MNVIALCLHSLDMRDFHSRMRLTPCLDELRTRSVFIPASRGHGHNNKDSIHSEITGQWTARMSDSKLTADGFVPFTRAWLPKTLGETLAEAGYDIITCNGGPELGNASVGIGLRELHLADEPERMAQFDTHHRADVDELIAAMRRSKKFFAHLFLRQTHRTWAQNEGLCALVGKPPSTGWPECAFAARKAALERPDEFAALRRRGLAMADAAVAKILAGVDLTDTCVIVYSNHGEVFDHFRYHLPYRNTGGNLIVGVSHGPYPYEVLFANMQMWLVPGMPPRVLGGMGRSVDLTPTVLDIAGVPHGPMDGESMLASFRTGERLADRERHAESGTPACGSSLAMTRADGMTVIGMTPEPIPDEDPADAQPNFHKLAVFDLSTDAEQQIDLIDTPIGRETLDWALARHAELKQPL